MSRKEILARNVEKAGIFRVGDTIRFKKPRNRKVLGTIVEIQEDVDKVTWATGGKTPMNIVIDVLKENGGVERVKTNVKKIVYVKGVEI